MRRCFVISPIGDENSAIREHADDVYEYIIKPALEGLDVQAVRSDHLHEPGLISEQMFREILQDDLCIALLTGHNPNVFYELAIAHAARRPVIILLEKGSLLPFDIKDLRCVYYDLKPRSLFEGVYANQISEHVRGFEAASWQFSSPLDGVLPDPGSLVELFHKSDDLGGPEDWRMLLERTETGFDIMGFHLGGWTKDRRFETLVQEKAERGCQVRILLMHPDNPLLKADLPEGDRSVWRQADAPSVERMFTFYHRLAEIGPNIEARGMLTRWPTFNLTRTDLELVAIDYLHSEQPALSPALRCKNGSALYETLRQEFNFLWAGTATES